MPDHRIALDWSRDGGPFERGNYTKNHAIRFDGGQTLHGFPRWFSTDHRDRAAPWTPHIEADL